MVHLLAVLKETVFLLLGSFAVLESIKIHHIHKLKKKIRFLKFQCFLFLCFSEKIRSLLFCFLEMFTFLDHIWYLLYVSISLQQTNAFDKKSVTNIHNSNLRCYLSVQLWASVLITQSFIFISKIEIKVIHFPCLLE